MVDPHGNKSGAASLPGALITIAAGLLILGLSYYFAGTSIGLVANGAKTSGIVVGQDYQHSGNSPSYYPIVEFTTSAGAKVKAKTVSGDRSRSTHAVGSSVALYYSRSDPQTIRLDEAFDLWSGLFLVPLGLLFLYGGLRMVRDVARPKSQTAEPKIVPTPEPSKRSLTPLVIGSLILATAAHNAYQTFRLIDAGVHTQGTVVSYQTTKSGYTLPVVAYADAGGQNLQAVAPGEGGKPFAIGESVALYYDPGHPKEIAIDTWTELWGGSAIIGGVGLVLVLAGSGLHRVRRRP